MTYIPKLEQQNNNVYVLQIVSGLLASAKKSMDEIDTQTLLYTCEKNNKLRLQEENENMKSKLTQKDTKLTANNSEIEELKARISRLDVEKIGWCQRDEMVEEKEKGLLEKLNEFTLQCAQLETEKNVLESKVGAWERKYIDMGERVSHLEGVVVSLINCQWLNWGDRLNLPTIAILPLVPNVVVIDIDEEAPEPRNTSYADGSSSESDDVININ